MSAFWLTIAYMVAAVSIIAALIVAAGCAAWRIVYYGFNCRRAPIQKSILLAAVMLWTMSAVVIKLL